MSSKKVTRREAVKTMAAAAAVVLAIPHLGSLALSEKETQQVDNNKAISLGSEQEPLVVLVGKDELKGFRGLAEYTVKDAALMQRIQSAFSSARAEKS